VAAQSNQGAALFQKGDVDDAAAQYKKAVEINPNYVNARHNLGSELLRKGHWTTLLLNFKGRWKSSLTIWIPSMTSAMLGRTLFIALPLSRFCAMFTLRNPVPLAQWLSYCDLVCIID
jgi:hypothetical protein